MPHLHAIGGLHCGPLKQSFSKTSREAYAQECSFSKLCACRLAARSAQKQRALTKAP